MGIDITKSIDEIQLKDKNDFDAFSQMVSLKLSTNPTRTYMVNFINDLIQNVSDHLTSDDVSKIQAKATVIFNQKLKEKQPVKKKAKPKKLQQDNNLRNVGYDLYEVEGEEGTEDYGGYNEVDFM